MGDYEGGAKFFEEYMKVDEEFLKMRKIVFDHLLPRRLELQVGYFSVKLIKLAKHLWFRGRRRIEI
jgi:hypothetical protein